MVAACFNSSINILIPSDMLADFNTATFFDASSTFFNCSSESPVVQSTTGICLSTLYTKRSSTAFALEKSMITSAATSQTEIFGNTG